MDFCEDCSGFFISQGRNRSLHAKQYLSGLLGDVRRKNIERIGEEVAEVDYQSMHNFVSESQWDYRALVDQVARDANILLGGNAQSMLLLDETSFLKKSTLKAQVLVIALCDKDGLANGRSLVISCDGTGAIKYSLTNAQGSARELCYRQHQRYWIERAIQEAKSEVGMAQYQVRGWFGWHQHIAMVTLAMLFALQQKIAYRDCVPLLSTHDIVELLSYYLPSKKDSEQEIFKQMALRHTARLKSIEHHYRKQKPILNC